MNTNPNPLRDQIAEHLDINRNHEAGLIPLGTQAFLRNLLDAQDPQAGPVAWMDAFDECTCGRGCVLHPSPQPTDNTALVEALKPFADAIKYVIPDMSDDYMPGWAEFFTYGDFRRAAAALSRAPQPAPEAVAEAYDRVWQLPRSTMDCGTQWVRLESVLSALKGTDK